MRFEAPTGVLDRAVRDAAVVATARGPVHGLIRLTCEEHLLRIDAFSDDASISIPVTASISTPGVAVLPVRPLVSLLATLSNQAVQVSKAGQEVVAAQDVELRLQSADPMMWPRPLVPPPPIGRLDTSDLEGILRIAFAASKDPNRPALMSVRLENGFALASDGFRLARARLEFQHAAQMTIPIAALRLLHQTAGGASVRASASHLWLDFDSRAISLRLLDIPYPVVAQLLASIETPDQFEVRTDELLNALDQVAVFGGDETLILSCRPGTTASLTLSCRSPEVGVVRRGIRAQGSPPLRLAMKLRFLRDAVQALDAESVVVAYGRPDKPIRIERDGFLVVTSPVVLPVELES